MSGGAVTCRVYWPPVASGVKVSPLVENGARTAGPVGRRSV